MGDHWKWKRAQKPKILKTKDIQGLAEYIKSNKCNNIALMLGAGVSTSAGIPDFRSPKTGLYSNLARLNLPHPEAVFEINFFRRNPVPFYTLAQELYPGKFRPTITHSFIRLLHNKGLLLKCFTQNIDTLERRAGVPDDKVIEAHGSFASQRCIDCGAPYDDDLIKVHIKEKTIPRCEGCRGLVKPDIVFFGEALPKAFGNSIPVLKQADLIIVMGTSLTVHPFAMLAELVGEDCPRVLVNLERVGSFADRPDDVLLLGKCDEMVKALCRELGWEAELEELWKATEDTVEIDEDELDREEKAKAEAEKAAPESDKAEKKVKDAEADQDKRVQDEVDSLTSAVERSLTISSEAEPASEGETKIPEPKGSVLQIPTPVPSSDEQAGEAEEKTGDTAKDEGKL